MKEIGIVDFFNPNNNMYGCSNCPQCDSRYRVSYGENHPKTPNKIVCDKCGFIEDVIEIID